MQNFTGGLCINFKFTLLTEFDTEYCHSFQTKMVLPILADEPSIFSLIWVFIPANRNAKAISFSLTLPDESPHSGRVSIKFAGSPEGEHFFCSLGLKTRSRRIYFWCNCFTFMHFDDVIIVHNLISVISADFQHQSTLSWKNSTQNWVQ